MNIKENVNKKNPRVFISYSHKDSEYEKTIYQFANKLREDGIDANIDLYEEAPKEGWQRWTEKQIEISDFVLIVNDKTLYEKINSEEITGKGVMWEITVIYQHLYDNKMSNSKFIPVFLKKEDEQYVLTPLRPFTFYNVGTDDGYKKLYNRLLGINIFEKPPLGKNKSLPQKKIKTVFFDNPIDKIKWDKAKWHGAAYLFSDGCPPVLALLFKNYDDAKRIFLDWQKKGINGYCDYFMNITFITPPFPNDCWVFAEKERNFGNGYFIHIGSNIKNALHTMNSSDEDSLLLTFSRYQWMNTNDGTYFRDRFKIEVMNFKEYLLLPSHIIDESKPISMDNIIFDFNYAVKMKDVLFKEGINLANDACNVVLNNPMNFSE